MLDAQMLSYKKAPGFENCRKRLQFVQFLTAFQGNSWLMDSRGLRFWVFRLPGFWGLGLLKFIVLW